MAVSVDPDIIVGEVISQMIRTIVSLSEEDKAWLDAEAGREGVAMAEIVRRAVRHLRRADSAAEPSFDDLLEELSGTWTAGDALDWQRKLRDEWSRA